ncbi:MAG TPA: hypothetical protein VFE62_24335 [Gemmataceae bacterium]|nr:hypothetical protein [Gemmataceae bacterium]
MPSRLISAGIIAFWLTMTGLLLYQEVVPMMLAEIAPTVTIDLTDEIGSPLVGWTMYADGKRIGSATSKINALEGRAYEFHSAFHFDDDRYLPGLRAIETKDRVAEDNKLLGMEMKVVFERNNIDIKGDVVDKILKPRLYLNDKEFKDFKLGEIDMTSQPNVVSSLKLVSRLRGLHEGQTWTETTFDPSSGIKDQFAADLFKQVRTPSLIAQVKSTTLTWDKKEVGCFLVEYYDAHKDVVARVWVRKRDGLVIQREVAVLGKELTLRRIPN